jgi:hypothetical protein
VPAGELSENRLVADHSFLGMTRHSIFVLLYREVAVHERCERLLLPHVCLWSSFFSLGGHQILEIHRIPVA